MPAFQLIDAAKIIKKIPSFVEEITRALQNAGFDAYLTGGCVRDLLLNRSPKDWDVVTSAPQENLVKIFPRHLEVGLSFGILKLKDHPSVDVATFREDGPYRDGRRPAFIRPGSLASDSKRRDFTINALYLNLSTAEIIDPVGGLKDLRQNRLRSVGAAQKRFSEDGLRLLRALRFEAQLGFKIHPATLTAIFSCRRMLQSISRERVRDEILKALACPNAPHFLKRVASLELHGFVFPALNEKTFEPKNRRHVEHAIAPEFWLAYLYRAQPASAAKADLCLSNEQTEFVEKAKRLLRATSPFIFEDRELWDFFQAHQIGLKQIQKLCGLPLHHHREKIRSGAKAIHTFHENWPHLQKEALQAAQLAFYSGAELGDFLRQRKAAAFANFLRRVKPN